MKNFELVKENINASNFLTEIEENEKLWHENTKRQEKIYVQQNTNSIALRTSDGWDKDVISSEFSHLVKWTKMAESYPIICKWVEEFCDEIKAELGWLNIVRLKPESKVYQHIDYGDYYKIRDRYHLIIKSDKGSYLASGDEHVVMKEGELWKFNNKLPHSAKNLGDEWRVHIIFDVLPFKMRKTALGMLAKAYDNALINSREENKTLIKANDSDNISINENKLFDDYIYEITSPIIAGRYFVVIDSQGRAIEETILSKNKSKWLDSAQYDKQEVLTHKLIDIKGAAIILCNSSRLEREKWCEVIKENSEYLSKISDDVYIILPELNDWQTEIIKESKLPEKKIVINGNNIIKVETLYFPKNLLNGAPERI